MYKIIIHVTKLGYHDIVVITNTNIDISISGNLFYLSLKETNRYNKSRLIAKVVYLYRYIIPLRAIVS
jgi:hypothetical protein